MSCWCFLIIFMVAAPLATVDVPVDLPGSTAAAAPRPDKPLFVTVGGDLSISVGEDKVERELLASRLDAATGGDKARAIFLRADKTVAYGDLAEGDESAQVGRLSQGGLGWHRAGRCSDGRLTPSRDRTDPMEIPSRPMTGLLSRRSGVLRWSLAGAFGLALHGGALWWLIPADGPAAASVAPEAVVMIDLPPEPELPPLESVEQAAVEEVVEATPEEVAAVPPEPEPAETTSQPEELETVEPVEDLAEAPPEPVEAPLPEPEMLPPSEVAMPLPPPPPPEMVETTEGEAQARADQAGAKEADAQEATRGEADSTGRCTGRRCRSRTRGGRRARRLSQFSSTGHCRQTPGERCRRRHRSGRPCRCRLVVTARSSASPSAADLPLQLPPNVWSDALAPFRPCLRPSTRRST